MTISLNISSCHYNNFYFALWHRLQSFHSPFPFHFHIWILQERIRFLENAQGTSVQALISRITHYGGRRLEDFDKYEVVRLEEELVSVAKTTVHAKAASYGIIATSISMPLYICMCVLYPPISPCITQIRYFLISFCLSIPPLGWHSQGEAHFLSRINGAEFAIPWAHVTSNFPFSFYFSSRTLAFKTGKNVFVSTPKRLVLMNFSG